MYDLIKRFLDDGIGVHFYNQPEESAFFVYLTKCGKQYEDKINYDLWSSLSEQELLERMKNLKLKVMNLLP